MNVVSYSLWGGGQKYLDGAVWNADLVRRFYPDYIARFYCGSDVPEHTISGLKNRGADVHIVQSEQPWDGLFWRFMALEEDGVVLIRDTDSRITTREVAAVREWLASEHQFHVMRDHIEHNVPIMGGLFGCRSGLLKNIGRMIADYPKRGYKGVDQEFLNDTIWPLVREHALVHDRYHDGVVVDDYVYNPIKMFGEHRVVKFPEHEPMEFGMYVGQVI